MCMPIRKRKSRFAGLLQSPLTDSNRRPPPYHGASTATGRNRRQRFPACLSRFAAAAFATGCHPLRPLGSINAPQYVADYGYIAPALRLMPHASGGHNAGAELYRRRTCPRLAALDGPKGGGGGGRPQGPPELP